jgi:hypothetical protein
LLGGVVVVVVMLALTGALLRAGLNRLVSCCWVLGFFHCERCCAEAARKRREVDRIMARRTRASGIGVVFPLLGFFVSGGVLACFLLAALVIREQRRGGDEEGKSLLFDLPSKITPLLNKIYHSKPLFSAQN